MPGWAGAAPLAGMEKTGNGQMSAHFLIEDLNKERKPVFLAQCQFLDGRGGDDEKSFVIFSLGDRVGSYMTVNWGGDTLQSNPQYINGTDVSFRPRATADGMVDGGPPEREAAQHTLDQLMQSQFTLIYPGHFEQIFLSKPKFACPPAY